MIGCDVIFLIWPHLLYIYIYLYLLDIDNFRDCPAGFLNKNHQDVKHEPATTANIELNNGWVHIYCLVCPPTPNPAKSARSQENYESCEDGDIFSMMISMKVGLPPVLIHFCFVCSIINHPAIGIHPILGNLHLPIKWLI